MPRDLPELKLHWNDPVSGRAKSVPLQGAVRIGSDRHGNDVVLPLQTVEPFHAEVAAIPEGGWEVVSLVPRRLKIGEGMAMHARLADGSTFSVGPVTFHLLAVEAAPPRPVSGSGSRAAFVPPSPTAIPGGRRSVAAGLLLVAATAAAAWSALRERTPAPDLKSAPTAVDPFARPHPKARTSARPAPLEAGSIVLAPADEPRDPAGSVTVLVRLSGATVPIRGFFVSAGGQLVTSYRVVAGTDSVAVFAPGSAGPVPARVVATDAASGLALLQASVAGPVPVAPLDDDAVMRSPAFSVGASPRDVRAFAASNR
jgi:hypothetical protein